MILHKMFLAGGLSIELVDFWRLEIYNNICINKKILTCQQITMWRREKEHGFFEEKHAAVGN